MLSRLSLVRYQYPLLGGVVITLTLFFLYNGSRRLPLPTLTHGSSSSLQHLEDIKNATLGVRSNRGAVH